MHLRGQCQPIARIVVASLAAWTDVRHLGNARRVAGGWQKEQFDSVLRRRYVGQRQKKTICGCEVRLTAMHTTGDLQLPKLRRCR